MCKLPQVIPVQLVSLFGIHGHENLEGKRVRMVVGYIKQSCDGKEENLFIIKYV